MEPGQPVVYMEPSERRYVAATAPIGEVFSQSWALFRANWAVQAGATAVALLIFIGIEAIPVLGQVIGFVMIGPLWAGLVLMSLNIVRGKTPQFGETFAGFGTAFVNLMLLGMAVKVLIVIGLLLCIVPGVYLAVAWCFPFFLAVDRNEQFWRAMEISRKTVHPRWGWFFLLWAVSVLLLIAGGLLFGVGLLVTIPLVNNAFAVVYHKTFSEAPGPAENSAGPTGEVSPVV